MAEIVINGEPYEVVEWSLEDPDCDGAGTYRWVLYATPVGHTVGGDSDNG